MDRDETIRLRSTSRVRWSSFDEALAAAPYDLVLTTGFWSRGRPGPNAQEIEAAMSADGLLVMLERFTKPEPVSDQLLSRVLSMLVSALPSGWQALEPNRHPEPPGCRLETDFAARFECREIRPFGGTIAQPLIERLQPDFLQLGAGTLMGAVTGTYLALEETLILTGLLVSPFNLLVASRRGSELQVTRKVPTGWAIAPSTDLSALISAPAPPTS
jgi:hypothetical protein